MPTPVRSWSTPSSQGTTTYETVLYSDGSLSCNCPGWVFAKKNQPRGCKHTKKYAIDRPLAGTPGDPTVTRKQRVTPPPPPPRPCPTGAGGRAYSFDEEE